MAGEGVENGVPHPQPRHAYSQKLEEGKEEASLEPAEGGQPGQYLDFELPASRTIKE